MKEIIDFLRRLECHNERPWFTAHKEEFLAMQDRFHLFAAELITELGRLDASVAGLTVADCTYRIYRDTRFSNDKRPYKTHFGVFVCPGGKKSGYSGYYFHVGTGRGASYPAAHMLAVGNYCISPSALRILREDICVGGGDFDALVRMATPEFVIDRDEILSRNPKGFPADTPWSEYLRLKNFCLNYYPDEDFVCAPDLAKRIATLCQKAKPFLDYVNRAITYDREEN